jgi:hypothetical protein
MKWSFPSFLYKGMCCNMAMSAGKMRNWKYQTC